MIPKNKKILFFSPHPDDDFISSGATLFQMIHEKNKILCVYMTSSPRGVLGKQQDEEKRDKRHLEARDACTLMGCDWLFLDLDKPTLEVNYDNVFLIQELIKKEDPDIIFLPLEYDAHPTHKKVNEIVRKAIKGIKIQKWYFEVWTPVREPNYIFYFDDDLMEKKKQAISKHASQLDRTDFLSAAAALNLYRGIVGKELIGNYGEKIEKDQGKYGEAFFVED